MDWKMAWTKEEVRVPNMAFEICNFLFNYAVLNANQALPLLREKLSVEQYKFSLQKLQYVSAVKIRQFGLSKKWRSTTSSFKTR